jgi:hypothetical protein
LTRIEHGGRIALKSLNVGSGSSMDRARLLLVAIGGSGVLLLAGFGPGRIEQRPLAQPAKLGFSYLSQSQIQDLWKRADNYAMAEVFLKQCGTPSYVERRMMLAARDCIEARALQRVAGYFRRKVAEFSGKHTFVCDTEPSKKLVKTTRAQIDKDVAEVRSMCRACLIC